MTALEKLPRHKIRDTPGKMGDRQVACREGEKTGFEGLRKQVRESFPDVHKAEYKKAFMLDYLLCCLNSPQYGKPSVSDTFPNITVAVVHCV